MRGPQLNPEIEALFGLGNDPDLDLIVNATVIARLKGVHPRTVQRWVKRGLLAAHRKGGVRSRLRVRLVDWLRALIAAGTIKTNGRSVALMFGAKADQK